MLRKQAMRLQAIDLPVFSGHHSIDAFRWDCLSFWIAFAEPNRASSPSPSLPKQIGG